MNTETIELKTKLFDFDFVGDDHFSYEDLLHQVYLQGKKDYEKELVSKLKNGLQTSALTSSLFREKLEAIGIKVTDMFLRIIDLSEFEALVVLSDEDYYVKDKRWNAYKISRNLNSTIDDLDIKFSLMPFSDKIVEDTIKSEGFFFKYVDKERA